MTRTANLESSDNAEAGKVSLRHRTQDRMHPMAGGIDGTLWRQLVRRTQTVSLSASPAMRRSASSLLLRRLQSTASPKPTFRRTSFRSATSNPFRRPYSSSPPPKKAATTPVKFWPFFLVVALSSGAYIALVNQRAGKFAPGSSCTLVSSQKKRRDEQTHRTPHEPKHLAFSRPSQ